MSRAVAAACCAAAAALALAACGKQESALENGSSNNTPAAAARAPASPVSIEKIESEAKGFNVGSGIARNTIYVFFDPQCPHCAALWESAKPLKGQARFVWIPVALLNQTSLQQGAALLAAPDAAAAMEAHEQSMRDEKGGIASTAGTEPEQQAVQHNTQLMDGFGFASVPTVIGKHAQTGELVMQEGALPTAALAQKFGLSAPQ